MIRAILDQLLLKNGICEVGAVPSQKIVDLVKNSHSKVRCVGNGLRGYLKQSDNIQFQLWQLCRKIQLWNAI